MTSTGENQNRTKIGVNLTPIFALNGRTPAGLGRPDLHHADQMPGSGIHEILPTQHRGNSAFHGQPNQGVTPEIRKADKELHWWYRAREQGADELFPDWIYDE